MTTRLADPQPIAHEEDTLVYLELSRRQAFALAFALIGHCRRYGNPRTPLQHDLAGLRDFLLHFLDEDEVATLLEAS